MRAWWETYVERVRFYDGGRAWPYLDCWGLAHAIFERELQITLDEWPAHDLKSVLAAGEGFLDSQFTSDFNAIETGLEQAFDVAVIRRPIAVQGRLKAGWWHIGVVTRPCFILHNQENRGTVEEAFRDSALALESPTLRARHVKLYRHCSLVGIS
jgi:hypothetical protein